ncbi:MAG: DUF5693 family protein [bacterium]
MFNKFSKGILVSILTIGVLLGAYLGFTRYLIELQDRTVEFCVDLNNIKTIAAQEKQPLEKVLLQLKEQGVQSIGVFEQRLPDAYADGDLTYEKGPGLYEVTIHAPNDDIRRRVYYHLKAALGEPKIKFRGQETMIMAKQEEALREIGLGISEKQEKYLSKLGFRIIPRVWQDKHFGGHNLPLKIELLKKYDTVIFDGEEILGYPDALPLLAHTLKFNTLKFGYIEIIKQFGNSQLKRQMGRDIIRVHSISQDELKKVPQDEAVRRFVRAAKERKVRLFYLRPYLTTEKPVADYINYVGQIKLGLEKSGFTIGQAESLSKFQAKPWQTMIISLAIACATLTLLNLFSPISGLVQLLIIVLMAGGLYLGIVPALLSKKIFALLATITFPSLAIISSLTKAKQQQTLLWDSTMLILNVVAELSVGILLLVGLLADFRFMYGIESFAGVKIALLMPIMIILTYFALQTGEGSLRKRAQRFLGAQIPLFAVLAGLVGLGALGIFIARSGNFVLPVPGFEKGFRDFLETVMSIRPRSKEFLIGYPALFLAALAAFRGNKRVLWLFATIGAIAPISIINTFSHVHTPLAVSISRTLNGLVLGIIIGSLLSWLLNKFFRI